MNPVTAVMWAGALLLVGTGLVKIVRPGPAAGALATLGLRWHRRVLARLLGGTEIIVGVGAVWFGGRGWCALLGLLYLGFSAALVVWLRTRPVASCGCTGSENAPPTPAHLFLTLAFSAAGFVAAAGKAPGAADVGAHVPVGEALILMGYALLVTALSWIVIAVLPDVRPSTEPPVGVSRRHRRETVGD